MLYKVTRVEININDERIACNEEYSMRMDGSAIYYTFTFPTSEQPERFSIELQSQTGPQGGYASFDAVTYEVIQ